MPVADRSNDAARSELDFTSGAFRGDAASTGGCAVASHAGQAQDGLLIGHQCVQDLLRKAAQRLGRRGRRALLCLHSTIIP